MAGQAELAALVINRALSMHLHPKEALWDPCKGIIHLSINVDTSQRYTASLSMPGMVLED